MIGKDKVFSFPLKQSNTCLVTLFAKAEFLANYYSGILGKEQILPSQPQLIKYIYKCQNEVNHDDTLNLPYGKAEISNSINSLKMKKASGRDLMTNEMLKWLPNSHVITLLNIFNSSWENAILPIGWKEADILPFPKPGKDLSMPSSYRPISLLSCTGKLMEKMVTTRLNWFLESSYLLPTAQCGFRTGRCTVDVLIQFENEIQIGFKSRKVMLAVFFDIEKAFDKASHIGILYKLCKYGIRGRLLHCITNFLMERSYSSVAV